MEETKKKEEQKKNNNSSIKINPLELLVQSIWNAITWIPAMMIAAFLDDD